MRYHTTVCDTFSFFFFNKNLKCCVLKQKAHKAFFSVSDAFIFSRLRFYYEGFQTVQGADLNLIQT